jgi:Uma2 family endonuclease
MTTKTQATIEDLYQVEGKAELVDEEIVLMSPTGDMPSFAAGEIFASLREHARRTKSGRAVTDNAGFRVDLHNRGSFSPDTAFYTGKRTGMKFFDGAPVFAVEVRSESDYGPKAEAKMAKKRSDYFAAGTLCVWDVDLQSPDVIKAYHASAPANPIIFHHGDVADAGEAVPEWSMPVDDLFPQDE